MMSEVTGFIGTKTLHGLVAAIGTVGRESYVWTIDKYGVVGMFPLTTILEEDGGERSNL